MFQSSLPRPILVGVFLLTPNYKPWWGWIGFAKGAYLGGSVSPDIASLILVGVFLLTPNYKPVVLN
jgi:hypothetical protein